MPKLTDTTVKTAKPGDSPRKLTDGKGLHLLVTTSGGKLWRYQYRFNGKQLTLALGQYPEVTLAAARDRHQKARIELANGQDPAVCHRLAKLAAERVNTNTFNVIADELLEKYRKQSRADATITKVEWLLNLCRPDMGPRPITELHAVEVLDVLRRVESKGCYDTAKRLRSTIGAVFRYAIATGRAKDDPTYALRGALITRLPTPRAAITDPQKFGALLRAIDGFDGQPATRAALQLMALLFPRPGELRKARWSEFDLDKKIWAIPAERTKMRREHRVPLPQAALDILDFLKLTVGKSELVLPSVRSLREPMSENTMNAALRRLGYGTTEATAHGFRASASTMLNESSLWHPDAIERQLAHVEQSSVRRAYARGEHWEERVRLMDWWAGQILVMKRSPGNIAVRKIA